ncbi:MAG: ribonuclease P protein component [Candidatus Paceibacterota bacterium]
MFSRRERLSRAQFPSALKYGRRLSSEHFLLVIPKKDVQGYAVIIPKKVVRLSSRRHRLKRQVLEALRTLPSLPPALIVFPRSVTSSVNYKDIVTELGALLSTITSK